MNDMLDRTGTFFCAVRKGLCKVCGSAAARQCMRWLCVILALALLMLLVHPHRFILLLALALLLTSASVILLCIRRRVIKSDKAAFVIFSALSTLIIGYFIFDGAMLYSARCVTYNAPQVSREIFSNKSVLILVPHEDDEINLCGGIIQQYDNTCDVHVVFSTNGDYRDKKTVNDVSVRFNEALSSLELMGVPRENVIFLGYGDTHGDGLTHIYNLPDDELYTSIAGKTHTYGTDDIQPWSSSDYTRGNMLADIKSVITSIRPDVIFCIDYDDHVDHRALSLLFEEAMGQLLADGGYSPTVYKGFAYSCAWYGEDDYYAVNLLPTCNIGKETFMLENNIYDWESRVRFPVAANSMARTKQASDLYKALAAHKSQGAQRQAARVINSDKVFWQRSTDSLLYTAACAVSSGEGRFLTDFKLTDSSDINSDIPPFENLWQPDGADGLRYAEFTFEQPQTLTEVRLYDNPSPDDNVLSVRLTFSDGSSVDYGALNPNGSATVICLGQKADISSVRITLLSGEGRFGLTEAEAYGVRRNEDEIVKLTDNAGNFVYDYRLEHGEDIDLSLYEYPNASCSDLSGRYTAEAVGSRRCTAEISGSVIHVHCPRGRAVLVRLRRADGTLADCVRISNPGRLSRAWWSFIQSAEKEYNCSLLEYQQQYYSPRLSALVSRLKKLIA